MLEVSAEYNENETGVYIQGAIIIGMVNTREGKGREGKG